MHLNKAGFSQEILKTINLYRGMKPAEIARIRARWACGINKAHLRYPLSEGEKVFYVSTESLVGLSEFGKMYHEDLNPQQLFTGVDGRDFRIAMILDRWSKEGCIDPPNIYVGPSQKICFSDGRHRTIAAFHLGEVQIPAIVHATFVDKISNILILNKTKTRFQF